MQENQNIQKSVLFDDSVSHINTSSSNLNIVHSSSATSLLNNTKKLIKKWYTPSNTHNHILKGFQNYQLKNMIISN